MCCSIFVRQRVTWGPLAGEQLLAAEDIQYRRPSADHSQRSDTKVLERGRIPRGTLTRHQGVSYMSRHVDSGYQVNIESMKKRILDFDLTAGVYFGVYFNTKTRCCYCSHINSHNQIRGHRTGCSHSRVEEYPKEKHTRTKSGPRT